MVQGAMVHFHTFPIAWQYDLRTHSFAKFTMFSRKKFRNKLTCYTNCPFHSKQRCSFCMLVSQLVSALSPVNHKGLHQGRTQTSFSLHVINFTSHHTTSHVFEPIYIPWALTTGTFIRQGDLFYSAGLHRNHVLAKANTGKMERSFGKNTGEWTRWVEISKEEIPGSKRSIYGYILTYSRQRPSVGQRLQGLNFLLWSSPQRSSKSYSRLIFLIHWLFLSVTGCEILRARDDKGAMFQIDTF